ncbi:MAG TPA: TlpA disulfide reductase family protein [Steroidobacteraceae bacterium]|nr:TlpA disulfide reductase family protein [Steroidobacteraceae bacterium]
MLTMRGRARHAIVLAIAIAAGIAAFFVSRALLEPEPVPPPQLKPAVIPEVRPDVTLADREGRMRALSEWDGKPLVINFWATWCAPCRREIPMLNALARDTAAEGIEVIGVAIDFREEVLKFLDSTPIDYTVLIGEQDGMDAARAFGMESIGLPFTAFTDSRGRIATIHVGELHRVEADVILSVVRALDAGQIDMAAARNQIRDGLAKPRPGS